MDKTIKRTLAVSTPAIVLPLTGWAAAGMADRFFSYREWIFPAYFYNFLFGIVSLAVLAVIFYFNRNKFVPKVEHFCNYLRSLPSLAIVLAGILVAVLLGILSNVLYLTLWFLSMIPLFVGMILFLVLLVYGTFRNKVLLSPRFMILNILIVISSICAAVLFIVLTKLGCLHDTNEFYWEWGGKFLTHPYDSLKSIWEDVLLFICEIPISLMFLWIGKAFRCARRKFSESYLRKQK